MSALVATRFLRDVRHGGDPDQALAVARSFARFVHGAAHTLDMAVYDMRLSGPLAVTVVDALVSAADRGVDVRLGYDAGKPPAATAETFARLQADPAPPGTADWVAQHFTGTKVQTLAISSAPQLMHSKYLVRDATASSSAVWTGSTNFTDDAWTRQENNIVTVASQPVAAAFTVDFEQMWQSGSIKGTGAHDTGSTTAGATTVTWDFAPGDGAAIQAALVALVDGATARIAIAAMVLTSHRLIAALAAAVDRGVPVSGIYDAGQMDPIVARWKASPNDADVVAGFTKVAAGLSSKHSTPYRPTSVHDFMHDKILVTDDVATTGSYNFSANAERNAENQLRFTDAALADRFAGYIATIALAYHRTRGH